MGEGRRDLKRDLKRGYRIAGEKSRAMDALREMRLLFCSF
jgi:hypothetical protein